MKYFIDFEANSPSNEIIEIGCVSEVGETFSLRVKPTTKIDPFITHLTGISESDVANAPRIDEAAIQFYNWLVNSQDNFSWQNTTIYCYGNADHEFLRCSANTCETNDAYLILAAMSLSMKDFTKKVNHFFKDAISLATAVNYFRTTDNAWEQKHGALDDAIALRELYNVLPRKYSLPCSPFIIKTEMGISRDQKGKGHVATYLSIGQAVDCVVKEILKTSPNAEVKPENVRKKIVAAINKKSSYINCKWKYVKIEKGEG
jgi:DNA polymerase III epsilon subunit-like protein